MKSQTKINSKYLIVGGGPGGVAAIEGIRRHDKEGKITLVDEQGELLYSKINLHFLLNHQINVDQLYLKKQAFYDQNDVETINKKLDNLDEFEYEKLILAPGGSPGKLGVEGATLEGIYTFYSLKDAKELSSELESSKDVLVVGGGFITLDVVDSLQKLNKNIHLVVRDPQLLQGKSGSNGAKILQNRLGEKTSCYFNEEVAKFTGETKVDGAILTSGKEVDCQLVIVAIGIVPNLEIAKQLNLEINHGVVVDEFQRTNLKNIYAVGDICEFTDLNSKEKVMAGNWFYAMESGRVAGENAVTGNIKNEAVPIVSKALLGTNLFFVGNVDEKFEKVEFLQNEKYFCAYLKNGILVGASAVGLPSKLALAKAFLGKKFELQEKQILG